MSEINKDESKKEKQILSCEKTRPAESIKYKKSLFKLKEQENLMEKSLLNLTENMKLKSEIVQHVLHDMDDISRKR